MHRSVLTESPRGDEETESGDNVHVTLDQVPRWIDVEQPIPSTTDSSSSPLTYFSDPLAAASGGEGGAGIFSRFPVDNEINFKIYLWRGNPWNLEVDAVVNSTNEVCVISFHLFLSFIGSEIPRLLVIGSYDIYVCGFLC